MEEDVIDEEAEAQDIIEYLGYAEYYFGKERRNNAFDYLDLGTRFFYTTPFNQVNVLYYVFIGTVVSLYAMYGLFCYWFCNCMVRCCRRCSGDDDDLRSKKDQ